LNSLADQKGYRSAHPIESFADAFGVLSGCALTLPRLPAYLLIVLIVLIAS
jgi:hypothetical protein